MDRGIGRAGTSFFMRHFFGPLVVLLLLAPAMVQPAGAQESSIVTLGKPVGETSSGDGNAAAGGAEAPDEAPAPCGDQPITIARMQWPSAALLAEIHARLLTANFGCSVQVVPGDLAATGSSMGSTGQPGVAPEMWISRVADIWNAAMKAQTGAAGRAGLCRAGVRGLVRARLCDRGASRDQQRRSAQGQCRGVQQGGQEGEVHLLPARLGLCGGQPQPAARQRARADFRRGRAGQPVRTRYADCRSGGPQGADRLLLLAAECRAGAVRFQADRSRALQQGRVRVRGQACLPHSGANQLCPRSGDHRACRLGLSRAPRRLRPISSAPRCRSPK